MKWKPGKRSADLEDRRSSGGGGGGGRLGGLPGLGSGGFPFPMPGGGRGGIGSIILMVVLYLVLGNGLNCGGGGFGPSDITNPPNVSVPASGTGADSVPGAKDPEAQEVDFVSFVLDDAQTFWAEQFRKSGRDYKHAKLVLFRQQVQSGCGTADSGVGPFYCPLDQKVYLDLGFFDELNRRFKAPGDFAQAYVITHEIGHHIQQQLGIEEQVRTESQNHSDQANDLSIRLELQADCFAGVWARSTYDRGILESGDLDEGLTAAAAVGDDRIQEQSGGGVHPDTWTHGSAEQRSRWLKAGFDGGKLEACDTFAADNP